MAEEQTPGRQASPGRDVFISYASHDKSVADAACEALEAAGVTCWIAPRNVIPGEFYADSIVHAIDSAKVTVLVLSQHGAASQHVLREVERASSKRHPVVSFRIDTAPLPAGLEYFLNSSQWLDARPTGTARALPRLVEAVKSTLAQPSATGHVDAGPSVATRANQRRRRMLFGLGAIILAGFAYLVIDKVLVSKHSMVQQSVASISPTSKPPEVTINDKSVAVLPFVDMSEKKDQEYFADGMAEEILDLLATIPALKVVGRTSSFQFKGKNQDLRNIGNALGANYVVEGSVRRSGDRVRLTSQLIDAHTGTHVWSGTFERPMGDVLKMQDEIATTLARALQISLGVGDLGSRQNIRNVDAYNLYLRGLHAADQLDEAGFREAVTYFKQSIDLDPTFAPAAGWLAMAYDVQGEWGFVAPETAFENARNTANATVKVAPAYWMPYAVLASIHQVYDWDWATGEAAVNQSLVLAPREPLVHFFASRYALMLGHLDDALAQIEMTLARDPLMPTAYVGVCWIQQRRGHLQEAEVAIRRALEISPSFVSGHYYLGLVLLARGEPKAALEAMRQETPVGGQLEGLAMVYFTLGRRTESDATLARLVREHPDDGAFAIAETYAYRGQFNQAFTWLDRAYKRHDPNLYMIKGDPPLQRIAGDPRYKAFLRRMQLPES